MGAEYGGNEEQQLKGYILWSTENNNNQKNYTP